MIKLADLNTSQDHVVTDPILAKVTGVYLDHVKLADDSKVDVRVKVEDDSFDTLMSIRINTCYTFMYLECKHGQILVIKHCILPVTISIYFLYLSVDQQFNFG